MSSTWHYHDQDLDRYERKLDALEYESVVKDPYRAGFFTNYELEQVGAFVP